MPCKVASISFCHCAVGLLRHTHTAENIQLQFVSSSSELSLSKRRNQITDLLRV